MTILLTGGTGFIGSHVLDRLIADGYEVILLKRSTSQLWRITNNIGKVVLYNVDEQDLEKVFQKHAIDCILHIAGHYVKKHKNIAELDELIDSNIRFPSHLLEFAAKYKVKGFINTGTFFEYKPQDAPLSERAEIEPYDYYAATKVAFESMLGYYTSHGSLKGITLKLFSPYGEKDNDKIIPLLIRSCIQNTPLSLTKGEQRLSFTYIGDIVDAYINAIKYMTNQQTQYEQFNIGSSQAHSIEDIVQTLTKMSPQKKNLIKLGAVPYGLHELMYMVCNAEKAEKLLHWKAKTELNTGLGKTMAYYQTSLATHY